MSQKNRIRATAVIVKDGKILVFKRIKNNQLYYVLPGGGAEGNETPEMALKREANEELSITVKNCEPMFDVKNILVPTIATIHPGVVQDYYYFFIKEYSGVPELGGEEKASMNERNQYHITWVAINDLAMLPDLYPTAGTPELVRRLKSQNYESIQF